MRGEHHVTTKAETEVLQLKGKEEQDYWQPPEARNRQDRILNRFQRECGAVYNFITYF